MTSNGQTNPKTWETYYLFPSGKLVKPKFDGVPGLTPSKKLVAINKDSVLIYLKSFKCDDEEYFNIPVHQFVSGSTTITVIRDDHWFEAVTRSE